MFVKRPSLIEVHGYFATDCNQPSMSGSDLSKNCGKLLKNEYTHSNAYDTSVILSVVCHLTLLL